MEESRIKVSRILLVTASVLVAFFLLLFAEVGLRIAGFRFDTTPRYMEFNFPNPRELYEIFEPDPTTLWKLKPGVKMGPIIEPINSKGFRGPEFSDAKSAGIHRLIALGDSVTFAGAKSYSRVLGECLGSGWEVINAGVPGYSVYQGLRQFETRIAPLDPDVVTVMFGWNDHWSARGYRDSGQHTTPPDEITWPISFFKGLRIYQLVHFAVSYTGQSAKKVAPHNYRVPSSEYRALLKKLVEVVRESGARPLLMTAPSALDQGKVPLFLIENGFVEHIEGESEEAAAERLKRLHADYNRTVRAVALEDDVPLLDLESQWYYLGTAPLFYDPTKDVVHPNERGYRLIGATLCDKVRDGFEENY